MVAFKKSLNKNIRNAQVIDISTRKKERKFETRIKIQSQNHIFYALKSGGSFNKSLSRAGKAIIKQVEKYNGLKEPRMSIAEALEAYRQTNPEEQLAS